MTSQRTDKTIGEFIRDLFPSTNRRSRCPAWPPDCFAVALCLLTAAGAYGDLLADWPPPEEIETWVKKVRKLSEDWRQKWRSGTRFHGLDEEWREVLGEFDNIPGYANKPQWRRALMLLLAVSDETFAGVGAFILESAGSDNFIRTASDQIFSAGSLSFAHWTRSTVLPKMHTPQKGLSDRSLSLNLSLYDRSEVNVKWWQPNDGKDIFTESLNLLVFPWPFEVLVSQFRRISGAARPGFGFFTYESEPNIDTLISTLHQLYTKAERKLGRVHGIVMPELSMSSSQYDAVKQEVAPESFLICGVGDGVSSSNEVRCWFPRFTQPAIQSKHHPWTMDESQIIQYGLGGALDPTRKWREQGTFKGRGINFLALRRDFVASVFICEDLARPDPVTSLVRAVGPNLILALLMDGPQLKERWAARYATVFADDPGSSVLAITSIGMAKLSHPKSGPNRNRVVAIWKDAFDAATEIELPEGALGLALTLSMKRSSEYSADGRERQESAVYPILSGVHPVFP